MFIKKAHIKNFRSIANASLDLGNLTVFVGANDAGKSNILKALNLFFNNETLPGIPLDFERDYSHLAITRKRKAKEIEITLDLQAPSVYKYSDTVSWTKKWRADSVEPIVFPSPRKYGGKKEKPARSKVDFWLDNLSFKYVPAVKGEEYFSSLLKDLHDVLSLTVASDIKNASKDFIDKIRSQTGSITKNIQNRLKIGSFLQLPDDLGQLFQILDFETDLGTKRKISLRQRGDGIKARHIPVVLKFIAEQANRRSRKSNKDVIWGYEEPENNLEMSYAYEQAKEFGEYANSIQILLTTHSPAFYSMRHKNSCRYLVNKGSNSDGATASIISAISNIAEIDRSMGLMHVVAPYISDTEARLRAIRNEMKNNLLRDRPTILVEGDFDARIIGTCLNKVRSNSGISVIDAHSADGVWKKLLACKFAGFKNKFLGLLDNDSAGKDAWGEWKKHSQNDDRHKIIMLTTPKHLYKMKEHHFNVGVSLEACFPIDFWKYADSKGWLENNRDVAKITDMKADLFGEIHQALSSKIEDDEKIYVLRKLRDDAKRNFSVYASKQILKDGIPSCLAAEIDRIIDFFT